MDYVKLIEENFEEIQTAFIKDLRDNFPLKNKCCCPLSIVTLKQLEEFIKSIENGDKKVCEHYEMDYIDKHFPFQNEEMDIEEIVE